MSMSQDSSVTDIYDPRHERDLAIPLPSPTNSTYQRVLLLGMTGTGKTTLLRQILGTDPFRERFPSTSTAKTTIADTEIILGGDDYRAVVTFAPIEEVREAIDDCIVAAVKAAYDNKPASEIQRRLLNHVEQRYRFSYVLGNPTTANSDDDEIDDDEEDVESSSNMFDLVDPESSAVDLEKTHKLLASCIDMTKVLATRYRERVREELSASESEQSIIDDLVEEALESLLSDDQDFGRLGDSLLDEVQLRFNLLEVGELSCSSQGWPRTWKWQISDRAQFIRQVTHFTGNSATLFGYLLTPLVNGIRVQGPFRPNWISGDAPNLVLVDSEGLGHTPNSSSAIPDKTQESLNEIDVILLVDNACIPMQLTTVSAVRAIISTGNATKLHIVFTHFDGVVGDNLGTFKQKEDHVIESVENVVNSIGKEIGQLSEAILRERLENATFFVGGIDKRLDSLTRRGRRTIQALTNMLDTISQFSQIEPGTAIPVYDAANIISTLGNGVDVFHEDWNARLGRGYSPSFYKEHWTRIKALSRRFAEQWGDTPSYNELRPIEELARQLQEKLWQYVLNPITWRGNASQEEMARTQELFANNISRRIRDISRQRLFRNMYWEWEEAYAFRGTGSTFLRADKIGDHIFKEAAPSLKSNASPAHDPFLQAIVDSVLDAADESDVEIINR